MKHFLKKTLVVLVFLLSNLAIAQNKMPISSQDYTNQSVEMADQFRADGKIYVVVVVVLLILGGIFMYLLRIDQKIEQLKKITENQAKL